MTNEQKVKAVTTYLTWPTDTEEQKSDVLEHIWWVVINNQYKEVAEGLA